MPIAPATAPKRNRAVRPIDANLGASIRRRRRELKLSQKLLGDKIGVTAVQISSYEIGANKISASQLIEIVQALDCRVRDLIVESNEIAGRAPCDIQLDLRGASELLAAYSSMPTRFRQTILELLVSIDKIRYPGQRRKNRGANLG
jgi:transcriptional regulator with XRE-family HTH domain